MARAQNPTISQTGATVQLNINQGEFARPNKTIESISARQTSAGQSEHHCERSLSWFPTEDLAPKPTLSKQKGDPKTAPVVEDMAFGDREGAARWWP
jgi:hypothetical protein